jgi:hypothetical protein
VFLLQAIVLLPFVGGLVAAIAGAWGAGALAITIYRNSGGSLGSRTSPSAPAPAAPQAV